MLTYLVPVGVLGFFAVYYFLYFQKVKKAGGFAAMGETYWREQFGLWPNERVVSMWVGSYYMGPLVPSTMQSTGEKVMNFLTNTTVRGAQVYFGFSDHQRMALAVEMNEDDKGPASSVGLAYAYKPLAIYAAETRAHVALAAEVYAGSPHLPAPKDRPKLRNLDGKLVTLELVVLTDPQGGRSTLWVDPAYIPAMQSWCAGGGVHVDPRYAKKSAA